MSFVMGGNEILREYRTAANKKTQLRILAELNACTRAEIADFLITCGESVDKRWLNGGSRKASTHTHSRRRAMAPPDLRKIHRRLLRRAMCPAERLAVRF